MQCGLRKTRGKLGSSLNREVQCEMRSSVTRPATAGQVDRRDGFVLGLSGQANSCGRMSETGRWLPDDSEIVVFPLMSDCKNGDCRLIFDFEERDVAC